MDMTPKISGDDLVRKVLLNLPKTSQNKALKPALRAGGVVVREQATANIKQAISGQSTGVLEKSLRVYNLRNNRGRMRVGVMVKRGLVNPAKVVKGEPVRVGLYLAVLEYGSQKLNRLPRSPLRRAIRDKQGDAVYTVAVEVRKRLQSAVEDAKRR